MELTKPASLAGFLHLQSPKQRHSGGISKKGCDFRDNLRAAKFLNFAHNYELRSWNRQSRPSMMRTQQAVETGTFPPMLR